VVVSLAVALNQVAELSMAVQDKARSIPAIQSQLDIARADKDLKPGKQPIQGTPFVRTVTEVKGLQDKERRTIGGIFRIVIANTTNGNEVESWVLSPELKGGAR